jgi:Pectate lyase superfamily protein
MSVIPRQTEAQTCTAPCYPQTASEQTAGITPTNFGYPPGNILRYGADPTGVYDSKVAFQNAITVAELTAGSVYVPATAASYLLTNTLSVTAGIRIYGDGYTPYVGSPSGDRGPGSWLQFAHLNVGIEVANGATGLSSVFIERIGSFRNQPAPAPGWVPLSASYDISIANADIHIRDVMLLNPTSGVLINNQVGARTFIDGLFGQPLTNGINVLLSEDTCRINNVHFWPYWENDTTYVNPWTTANLLALFLQRCDDPEISNFFSIFALQPITFGFNSSVSPQITSRALLNNIVLDAYGAAGVTVITGANDVSFAINNLVGTSSNTTSASSFGVLFSATSAIAQIVNARFSALGSSAISVNGTANNIKINNLVCDGYNGANNGSTCVFSGAGNLVTIGDPILGTATNPGPLISNPALISYNATASGAFSFVNPATSITVNHGLGHTPLASQILVSLTSAPSAAQNFFFTGLSATQFTINMTPGSSGTVSGFWTIDSRNTT